MLGNLVTTRHGIVALFYILTEQLRNHDNEPSHQPRLVAMAYLPFTANQIAPTTHTAPTNHKNGLILRRTDWICFLVPHFKRLLQYLSPHHHAADLVRSLVDLRDFGIAHHAFNREIAGVSVTTEQLHSVRRHLHSDV